MNLDGKPVMMIDNYFPRAGGQFLLFANTTDIFLYDESTREVAYLTPRYETGTVSVTNGSAVVTGSGTTWGSDTIKAGDFIHVGATGETDPTATWYEVASVDSDTQLTLTANYTGATAGAGVRHPPDVYRRHSRLLGDGHFLRGVELHRGGRRRSLVRHQWRGPPRRLGRWHDAGVPA